MAKTIIEYQGKRYQIVTLKEELLNDRCKGCAFAGDAGCQILCYEFNYNSNYSHILKEIKNGTK